MCIRLSVCVCACVLFLLSFFLSFFLSVMSLLRRIFVDFEVKLADHLIKREIVTNIQTLQKQGDTNGLSPAFLIAINLAQQKNLPFIYKRLIILIWLYTYPQFRMKLFRTEPTEQMGQDIMKKLTEMFSCFCSGKQYDGQDFTDIKDTDNNRHVGWFVSIFGRFYAHH